MPPVLDRVQNLHRRLTGRTRRSWVGNGRAHVEYRSVPDDEGPAFEARLVAALEEHEDVHTAVANPYVRRVVVAYDDVHLALGDLADLVEQVEAEFGVANEPFPPDRPDHPGDREPFLRELLELLTAVAGAGGTFYGRIRSLAPGQGPIDLSWLMTLLDNVPHLRRPIERQLGERATDLALSLSNSLLRAVNYGVTGHVVEIAQRATRLREIEAVQRSWTELEPILIEVPGHRPGSRPQRGSAIREGPIELYAERAWRLSLGGFAASLVATDDIERSAASLLDGIPKAARLGRSMFTSQLGRVLAQRGCLVLDPRPLTLLDRIDVVAVEAALLLHDDSGDGPHLSAAGTTVLQAARTAGLTILLVDDELEDLPELDGVERVGVRRADRRVAELQQEGSAVLAIGSTGAPAFRRADLRIGLRPPGHPPAWDSDVLLADELADALVVIRAIPAARRNSRHAVTLATTGAGIGAMTGLGGLRVDTARRVLRVIDGASMLAMGNGIRLASELAELPATLRRDEVPWHALPSEEVLERLGSGRDGLSSEDLAARHTPAAQPPSAVMRFGRAAGQELANPITPILAGGIGLSLATGSVADAGLVGSVIALNAAIGGAQRYRAERAVQQLFEAGEQHVTVVRDGRPARVLAAELVVGDLVRLGPGESVPADGRIVAENGLEVDESSLTGESLPVRKRAAPVHTRAVADRTSMLYQATTIAAGEATVVVVATGEETEARRAAAWAGESAPDTGVEARLNQLTKATIPLALASAAGVSIVGLLRRVPAAELVDASVGLAVAAVPEGLPLLATAAQRAAARRLSEHRVLVRNPRAIEALGRVDVLCADKTGTLTEGRIRLAVVSDGRTDIPAAEATAAAGDGSGRHARVLLAARRATPIDPTRKRLPHPTDHAVAKGTRRIGVTREHGGEFTILDDLPFEPGRSYHAVLAETSGGRKLSVKGAPEELLSRCVVWDHADGGRGLDEALRDELLEEAERLAAKGLRVLAVAERPFAADHVDDGEVEGLHFVGFLGLRDPVRPVSKGSIERLRRAGVTVIMITGDHPTTARSIAAELGLADGQLLTGPDIDALDDDGLTEVLPKVTVFARVTPLHKVRIVRAFQSVGRVVAMTGDGANDAPAIRLADVGIAVGKRATAAARETADVVVMDDRLEVIVDAIAEGRGLWGSVREAVAVLVGGNLGEIAFTLLGSAVGRHPPLNTRQLLLVNLLTDVAPAMALAVRAPHASVDELLVEGPEHSLGDELNQALVWRGMGAAVGATMSYTSARFTGTVDRARTVGMVALVGTQLGQTVAASRGDVRVLATGLGSFGIMAAMIQTPGISQLVGCRPMGPVGWLTGATGAVAGTALGVAGPSIERALTGEEARWSRRVIERLVANAPDLPGLTSR